MWKKQAIIAIALVAVILLFLSILLPCGMSLIVRDSGGRVYFDKTVRQGDMVSLGFKHSVEKVLVVDTFIVTADDSLLLVNTTYGSMGAGLPSDESYNITTDGHGNFTINDINESFRSINFMTGPIPKHYLIVAGKNYPDIFVCTGRKAFISLCRA